MAVSKVVGEMSNRGIKGILGTMVMLGLNWLQPVVIMGMSLDLFFKRKWKSHTHKNELVPNIIKIPREQEHATGLLELHLCL